MTYNNCSLFKNIGQIMLRIAACIPLCLLSFYAQASQLGAKVESEIRFDDRSQKPQRYQYRVRVYPHVMLDEDQYWSVNAFAVTGEEFSSSHNTLDDGTGDHFYLRRLYLRYEKGQNKTEFGVIPTYKGRVSSTGLSKDGFIAGIRQVVGMQNGRFEVVVGDLDTTQAEEAFADINELNYAEVEYSSSFDGPLNYEISADRVLQQNFVRGELRYEGNKQTTYAFELINRLDTSAKKIVLSVETEFNLFNQTAEVFSYYAYVNDEFGQRTALIEDFLATGHGVAFELKSRFNDEWPIEWFTKFEAYESNTRVQFGLKYGFSL
ncbi:hypothetical protein Q4574_03280 [Aliiglaciecola sp. 3_MG-2023]|uniref:hypothetical protein n=1 Tax=Aliiglaciecola sp. 3_MG-2023 TaxID=3062644 RepID=UPI0026E38FDA|nr:hypothetical protein [Aliiglaciecola sp. 3_MG-2023]MDO6692289.1 hypothetical protein [Aliiglaciecola sp. 3_MG-2023]